MDYLLYGAGALVLIALTGIRIIRPTHRGIVERLGKYQRCCQPGLNLIIPIVDSMYSINVTETMVEARPQDIITNDNLNAKVDAQIYYKVKSDEESLKNSLYSVNDCQTQIVSLVRTSLRSIVGTMSLKDANVNRKAINNDLRSAIENETRNWGIEIVRAELKEIDPPKDVQDTMNKVVKAANEKTAAVDFAKATETAADGERMAHIKRAEGIRGAKILEAEGQAQAIELVNVAAEKFFIGNAQVLRKLEAMEKALATNAKIIVPSGSSLVNVIGDMADVPITIPTENSPKIRTSQQDKRRGEELKFKHEED